MVATFDPTRHTFRFIRPSAIPLLIRKFAHKWWNQGEARRFPRQISHFPRSNPEVMCFSFGFSICFSLFPNNTECNSICGAWGFVLSISRLLPFEVQHGTCRYHRASVRFSPFRTKCKHTRRNPHQVTKSWPDLLFFSVILESLRLS